MIDINKLASKLKELERRIIILENPDKKFKPSKQKRSVVQFHKETGYVAIYESSMQAGNKLNINRATITLCCQGKQKQAGGYIWKYEDKIKNKKTIFQFTNYILTAKYKTIKKAAEENACSEDGIKRSIKTGIVYAGSLYQIGYDIN